MVTLVLDTLWATLAMVVSFFYHHEGAALLLCRCCAARSSSLVCLPFLALQPVAASGLLMNVTLVAASK